MTSRDPKDRLIVALDTPGLVAAEALVERLAGIEEVIVATIGVESIYGRNTGRFGVLEALTMLAFNYPPRAALFRSELEHYLLLTREARFEERALLGVEDVLLECRLELPDRRRRLLVLGDAAAHPHHVRERPVGDAFAVREAASTVPVDGVGDAVEVLVELPREPRLADSRRSPQHDRGVRRRSRAGELPLEDLKDVRRAHRFSS